MKSNVQSKDVNNIALFLKSILFSLILTFVMILLFALSIKWFSLSDSIITPVNLVIKGISVAFGTILFAKNKKNGLFKSVIFALSYTALAFILFSMGLLLDFAFTAIIGAIFGIISVNKN